MLIVAAVILVITAAGCDLLGIGDDQDDDGYEDSSALLRDSYSNTSSTDAEGGIVIDSSSFIKDIKITVEDPNGAPVENIRITYEQEDGLIVFKASDPNGYYADFYYFCNVLEELGENYSQNSIGTLENGNPRIVVSGTLLLIGLGLSFKAGLDAGDALYDVYDFHMENWDGSSLETTSYTTTVGEAGDLLKSLIDLSSLPASMASNISLIASGGASFKLKTGINIAKDWAASKIKSTVRNYLIDQTGQLIGDTSEIRITIHHFRLLSSVGFPSIFSAISPFFEQETGAIEIELLNSNEGDYSGDPIISDIYVYESGGTAYLNVEVKPAAGGIQVYLSLEGTDGYTQTDSADTDSYGEVTFAIPAGASGVKDTASVSLPAYDFKKIFAWYY